MSQRVEQENKTTYVLSQGDPSVPPGGVHFTPQTAVTMVVTLHNHHHPPEPATTRCAGTEVLTKVLDDPHVGCPQYPRITPFIRD